MTKQEKPCSLLDDDKVFIRQKTVTMKFQLRLRSVVKLGRQSYEKSFYGADWSKGKQVVSSYFNRINLT